MVVIKFGMMVMKEKNSVFRIPWRHRLIDLVLHSNMYSFCLTRMKKVCQNFDTRKKNFFQDEQHQNVYS